MTQEPKQQIKFGAFLGVFTPTMLTVLGVIMFLRLGWVIGSAGLGGAILIIVFSNAITLLTALSLSALATNMRVGVGGAYYLISRSLGLEAGGAIGIPLYLSQTLSLTLYAYGLAESFTIIWEGAPVPYIAAVIIIGVSAVAAKSTEMALKLQIPIMVLIIGAIAALVLNVEWGSSTVPLMGPDLVNNFWSVFAVFFPAVTGILAGVSMSGDLEDPGKAIPRGVLSAVAVGIVVYVALPFVLVNGATAEELKNPLVWTEIAPVWLVMPGLWGAILSSAFGSILAAPRTLQALAIDRLAPEFLAETHPETGEPNAALYVSGGVALIAVALGDLNMVAIVLTMFFLTTYGTLNLVAGTEALVGDLSYRPRIRVPWWASFAGALGCLVAMFAISPLACLLAIVVEVLIFISLQRRSMRATWGDVRSGVWHWMAKTALLGLRGARVEPRNWRPHFLVFTSDLSRNVQIVRLASALNQERGIITVATLLVGDIDSHGGAQALVHRNQELLAKKGITAFCEVASVGGLASGVVTVAQSNGFAGLSSNTVLFGWPGENAGRIGQLLSIVRKLDGLEKCSLIFRQAKVKPKISTGRVVIWWKGKQHNGDLMLLLAHLLLSDVRWRRHKIVLQSVVGQQEDAMSLASEFDAMLAEIRIDAVVNVIVTPDGEPIEQMIRRHSIKADLVFMGLPISEVGKETQDAQRLLTILNGLPDTILVRNAGPFRGKLL